MWEVGEQTSWFDTFEQIDLLHSCSSTGSGSLLLIAGSRFKSNLCP